MQSQIRLLSTHKNTMKISLNTILEIYLSSFCKGNEFANEDQFRDDLKECLCQHEYPTRTECQVDADPASGQKYWLVDLMVQTIKDNFVPIEVKFNEENVQEIMEDIKKIDYCIEHYENIEKGYVILLTDHNPSNFDAHLKDTCCSPFRYAVWRQ